MLAYAPRPQRQRLSPVALSLIVAGHVVVIGAVMSARMAVTPRIDRPLVIDPIPLPKPPDPVKPPPHPTKPTNSTLDHPETLTQPPPLDHGPTADPNPPLPPDPGPPLGTGPYVEPLQLDPPMVLTGPRFATPEAAIRPPYPAAKREAGEEASLRLRLTIDERGRVIAVDPVGRADPAFLDAARRHILRAWRYQPAMEGTKAVSSTTTITLKFELGSG